MMIRRLLPVFLVLLQSVLVAAHGHAHSDPTKNSDAPHLHLCELLELFGPAHHGDEGDHDHDDGDDDHDADAVDLSNVMASAAPPAVELVAFDLAPVDAGPTFEAVSGPLSFPVGLPPSTAGPHRPLYLTFCTLTI